MKCGELNHGHSHYGEANVKAASLSPIDERTTIKNWLKRDDSPLEFTG